MDPLSVADALLERRSVKRFDPTHRMTEQAVRHLIGHALLSPTAFNIQHWRLVRVEEPALRAALRACAFGQTQVTEASLLLVICFDKMAWDKAPERYWRAAPPAVRDRLVSDIRTFYANDAQLRRDEGMRSCGLIAMSLMLLAREMGYDSCAMDGFDFAAAGRLIGLPADHEICMMLAIGKKAREPFPRGGQLAYDEVVVTNRFN